MYCSFCSVKWLIHPERLGGTMMVMLCPGLHALVLLRSILTQATVGRVLNHSCGGRWRDRDLIQCLPGYLLSVT